MAVPKGAPRVSSKSLWTPQTDGKPRSRKNKLRRGERNEQRDEGIDDGQAEDSNEIVQHDHENGEDVLQPAAGPAAQGFTIGTGQGIKLLLMPEEPDTDQGPPPEKIHPQQSMTRFWSNFEPDFVGQVTKVLPDQVGAEITPTQIRQEKTHNAVQSYEQARENCVRDVKRIVRECRRLNQKYTDNHFDIERDLKITHGRYCLNSLVYDDEDLQYPSDAKRVTDVFVEPKFYIDGASYDDIMQGFVGDCWFLSALSALSCNPALIERICVAQDQEVGVYGFVFHRDGEWCQCIIDDKLYLRAPAFDETGDTVLGQYGVQRDDQEGKYKELFQQGSKSLYFAQCRDQNETWVALLEKAYAKAHGDYMAIDGGLTGEAIEDLTGGVTTEIYTTNILNRNDFWKNELSQVGKKYIFSCAAAGWRHYVESWNADAKAVSESRMKGIVSGHAYAVLATYEGHGQRLVKIRNPWGQTEWTGAWSDGSKEWTAEWLQRLDHQFGNDGVFWMSYTDMLNKYRYIDRTHIFDDDWQVVQQWHAVQVPWCPWDYQSDRFQITVTEATPAVIVLTKLDDRYFKGLEGEYYFTLQFRIQKDEEDEDDYLARTRMNYDLERSVNVEVDLEPGVYSVLVKIAAVKTGNDTVEDVIRQNLHRKDKIMQIGKLYDIAHQKGRLPAEPKMTTPTPAPQQAHDNTQNPTNNVPQAVTQQNGVATSPAPDTATGDGVFFPEPSITEVVQGNAPTESKNPTAPYPLDSEIPIFNQVTQPIEPNPPQRQATLPSIVTSDTIPKGPPEQQTEPSETNAPPEPNADDPDRDPWNANCIIGLRIYSKSTNLTLKVIHTALADDKLTLDRDDIAKSALEQLTEGDEEGHVNGDSSVGEGNPNAVPI